MDAVVNRLPSAKDADRGADARRSPSGPALRVHCDADGGSQ